MMTTFAMTPVFAMSIYKAILFLLVVLGWGYWSTILDKDASYYHVKRRQWNLINFAGGLLGFWLWLLVDWFWIGMPLALLVLGGVGVAYAITRNKVVPEDAQWHLDMDFFRRAILERRMESASKQATLRFIVGSSKTSKQIKPVPLHEDPEYRPHILLEELMEAALTRHAQRVDLAGTEQEFKVQLFIDGVLYRHEALDPTEAVTMVNYLKDECGMDVADQRRKQSGRCFVDAGEYGQHSLLVQTAGSTRGMTCQIHIDPDESVRIPFKDLGLLPEQVEKIEPVIDHPEGVVLVTCAPRQGCTTTVYALLEKHDPYTMDIHAIETSQIRELEGVRHHEVGPEGDPVKTLHSLLLRDPKVVMLEQMKNEQMAKAVATPAATEQKRFYIGMHGKDTFQALRVYMKAVGDRDLAGRSLAAITAQRLVRKLCPTCRQSYQPDPKTLKKLNLPADRIQQLYKASGQVLHRGKPEQCPECGGIGYRGRTGVFEVMVLDDQAKRLVRAGQLEELRTYLRRSRMRWLQEAALVKVVQGETSISEVMRVFGGNNSEELSNQSGVPVTPQG